MQSTLPPRPPARLLTRCQADIRLVPFTPVQKGRYDLRLLQPHTVAVTPYQRRDEGFLALGTFLSGGNAAEARCLETQPVVMTFRPDGTKTMQVYVCPRDEALRAEELVPLAGSGVELDAAGGELVASLGFEGNATKEACERALGQLLSALAEDGLGMAAAEAAGQFRLAQYGPIHSLSTRLNEIWVTVKV